MRTAHNAIAKEDLIQDIKDVYKNKSNDIKFTMQYYIEHGKYSKAPIKRFGGWNSILSELGLSLNVHYTASKQDIINDFLEVKQKYGSISCTTYRKYGKYSQVMVDKTFGSFSNMLKEIDIVPIANTRRLSDEEILNELRELYNEYGYLNSSLIEARGKFTYQTVLNRFGLMSVVYEKLNIDCQVNRNRYFYRADEAILIASKVLNEQPIKEWTCPTLKNPEQTCHLYVDAYFPKAQIALEYDGPQHDEYVAFLHKTPEKFERTQMLDEHKEQLLMELGIRVVRIKHNDDLSEEFISQKLN